jgi:hypothetical protein
MAGRSLFVALFVFLAGPAGPLAAQAIDTTGYVRGLYRDYLGREPSPDESLAWVRALQRGTAASEVNAFVLASDECFDRYRRDPNAWITATYRYALNRQPAPRDLAAWSDRLNRLNGDRLRWARDFLKAADWQAPSFVSPGTVIPASDLPTRLVTTSQLLIQAAQTELPGNGGWLASTQANNLLTSAEANRLVLASPTTNPIGFNQAVASLQTANDALRQTLAAAGPSAITSRQYADQIYQILVALRDSGPALPPPTISQFPPYPPPTTIPPGGIDQGGVERCQRLVGDLQKLTQQFVFVLRNAYPRDWNIERLLRDAEEYDAAVDRFRVQARVAASLVDLRASLTTLRVQGDHISNHIRRGTFDRRVIQAWSDVAAAFNRLAESQGISTGDVVDPWQPVPWSGPGGLPVNLGGSAPPTLSPLVVQNIDESISQCDTLTASLTPYAFQSPLIGSVQDTLRTLRGSLTELRRLAVQGGSRAQLVQALTNAADDARRVESLWNRVATSPGVPRDLPDLALLRRSFQQVNDPSLFSNLP